MKVSNADLVENRRQLKRLNDLQRRKIKAKEKELDKIDEIYSKRAEQTHHEGELKVNEVRDANKQKLIHTLEGKHQRLEQIKADMTEVERRLEQQRFTIRQDHKKDLKEQQDLHAQRLSEKYDIAREQAIKISEQAQNKLQNIQKDTNTSLHEMQYQSNLKVVENQNKYQGKMDRLNAQYKVELQDAVQKQQQEFTKNRLHHSKKMQEIKANQKSETFKRQQIFGREKLMQETQQQRLLKQHHNNFKKKISDMTKDQEHVINQAKTRFAEERRKLKNELSTERKSITEKVDNDFYRINKMQTKLVDKGDHYIVSLKVPDYEYEKVQVTGFDRTIRVNFGRRFSEKVVDENGETHQSNRSETFSNIIPTEDIIDPKTITQSYKDGILSFKINKS